jgi:hypothetical protein
MHLIFLYGNICVFLQEATDEIVCELFCQRSDCFIFVVALAMVRKKSVHVTEEAELYPAVEKTNDDQ